MQKTTKRLIGGASALAVVVGGGVAIAQSSTAAEARGNATAKYGAYKATYIDKDDILKIYDDASGDGYAAVVYFTSAHANGTHEDNDRFVVTNGYRRVELGNPDGSGNIPENLGIRFYVCKGYANDSMSNCDYSGLHGA